MPQSIVRGWILVLSILLSSCVSPNLSRIAIAVGPDEFAPGDSIVVEEVLSTSTKLEVGTSVLVRGRYQLASKSDANLGVSLTAVSPTSTRSSPFANREISQGSGTFELIYVVRDPGCLRVAFSHLKGGGSFGTVYFGTPDQLATVNRSPVGWIK